MYIQLLDPDIFTDYICPNLYLSNIENLRNVNLYYKLLIDNPINNKYIKDVCTIRNECIYCFGQFQYKDLNYICRCKTKSHAICKNCSNNNLRYYNIKKIFNDNYPIEVHQHSNHDFDINYISISNENAQYIIPFIEPYINDTNIYINEFIEHYNLDNVWLQSNKYFDPMNLTWIKYNFEYFNVIIPTSTQNSLIIHKIKTSDDTILTINGNGIDLFTINIQKNIEYILNIPIFCITFDFISFVFNTPIEYYELQEIYINNIISNFFKYNKIYNSKYKWIISSRMIGRKII
jgi:hypothetical protein